MSLFTAVELDGINNRLYGSQSGMGLSDLSYIAPHSLSLSFYLRISFLFHFGYSARVQQDMPFSGKSCEFTCDGVKADMRHMNSVVGCRDIHRSVVVRRK